MHNIVDALNTTELFTLKWQIVGRVNFTAVKEKKRIHDRLHYKYLSDPKAWDDQEWELESLGIPFKWVAFRANPTAA